MTLDLVLDIVSNFLRKSISLTIQTIFEYITFLTIRLIFFFIQDRFNLILVYMAY
jgi:hypothetical protein